MLDAGCLIRPPLGAHPQITQIDPDELGISTPAQKKPQITQHTAPAEEHAPRSVPVFALSGETDSSNSIGWVGQCEGWQLSASSSAEQRVRH
jgi:hypothetical protein